MSDEWDGLDKKTGTFESLNLREMPKLDIPESFVVNVCMTPEMTKQGKRNARRLMRWMKRHGCTVLRYHADTDTVEVNRSIVDE